MDYKEFPMTFAVCPNCGSERRVAGTIVDKLKEEGKVGDDTVGTILVNQVPIADPRKTTLTVPVLTVVFEACADCGTVYVIQASVQDVVKGSKGISGKGMGRN